MSNKGYYTCTTPELPTGSISINRNKKNIMALFKGKTNRKKAITYGPFFKEKLGGIQIGGKSIKLRRGNDKCKFLGFLTL